MPVLVTIREEPSGIVSVDFVRSGRERVVVIDLRVAHRTGLPGDLTEMIREVTSLPPQTPWRSDLLAELAGLRDRAEVALALRKVDDGPDLTDAG